MSLFNSVHHINFIVENLAHSVKKYEQTLGIGPFELTHLPERGVSTARVSIGGVWLVLVCPEREDSVPGRYLKEHGEGFFLLSFGVDDLDRALVELAERGAVPKGSQARRGIMDWRISDLDTIESLGVMFHVTETE